MQWDFQNKGRCIVLEVPLCNLLTSISNFVPCDWVVQRAYYFSYTIQIGSNWYMDTGVRDLEVACFKANST